MTSNLFADDAKIYSEINTPQDIIGFQSSLDALSAWANTWQLQISVEKCSRMNIASNSKAENFESNTIDGHALATNVNIGIKLDSN